MSTVRTVHRQRQATIASRYALFEEAAAIIAFEYPERLELEQVARRLACSPRQLQRAFADAAQTSFRDHLHAVRMERADELLRDGSLWVWEVAEAVGYSQPNSRRPSGAITAALLPSSAPRPSTKAKADLHSFQQC